MELRLKDLAEILNVSEKQILDWVRGGDMPYHRVGHLYYFNRGEVGEWIVRSGSPLSSRLLELSIAGRPTRLTELMRAGGVHEGLPGSTRKQVLHNAILAMPGIEGVAREDLLKALLDREELMSTAIGHRIAVPHPRNPIVANIDDARVALCYLATPVDYDAPDGLPVDTLVVILSYSPRRHLEVLSKISYLCHMESFRDLLARRASPEVVFDFVHSVEVTWQREETQ
ncbi:MAG TPA: PTS sugar transporter subunit IIA [Spirochaetia bacterium]|nr:PTS sugar transporter subunit IIA [Spirochaetia bacterium]